MGGQYQNGSYRNSALRCELVSTDSCRDLKEGFSEHGDDIRAP
jgi:hypothetical protein